MFLSVTTSVCYQGAWGWACGNEMDANGFLQLFPESSAQELAGLLGQLSCQLGNAIH